MASQREFEEVIELDEDATEMLKTLMIYVFDALGRYFAGVASSALAAKG